MPSRILNLLLALSAAATALAQDSSLTPAQVSTVEKDITCLHDPGTHAQCFHRDRKRWQTRVDGRLRIFRSGEFGSGKNIDHVSPGFDFQTDYRDGGHATRQRRQTRPRRASSEILPGVSEKQWPITARELLGHLAGIRHYKHPEEYWSTIHYASVTESLDFFKADPLDFEPETKYQYSTFGFSILGCEVEGASGMKFMDFVKQKFFIPAGMEHIQIDDTFTIIPNRAHGYRKTEKGEVVNTWLADTSNKIPGGGMISTATDLADFAIATMHAKLVPQATLEKMWTPQTMRDGKKTGSGLDWGVGEIKGHKKVSHSGAQPGTSTDLILVPDLNAALVVMINMDGVPASQLADKILEGLVP